MTGWSVFVDVFVLVASVLAILEYFGVKPRQRSEGAKMSPSRKWKLAIMLTLVAASLSLSGYSFYRSRHPIVIEKIVEKPVDRIVEKLVPQECQKNQNRKPQKLKPSKASQTPATASASDHGAAVGSITQGPDSIAQVGGAGNSAVINAGFPRTVWNENGTKIVWTNPGTSIFYDKTDQLDSYNKYFDLQKESRWSEALALTDSCITATPDWLTPYVFSATANYNLGNYDKAYERIKYFFDHADVTMREEAIYKNADTLRGALKSKHNIPPN
jgi:hypothetical protein